MSISHRNRALLPLVLASALLLAAQAGSETLNNLSCHLVSCPYPSLCSISPSTPTSGSMTCPAGATCCAPKSTCNISGPGFSQIWSEPPEPVTWRFFSGTADSTFYLSLGGDHVTENFYDWARLDVQELSGPTTSCGSTEPDPEVSLSRNVTSMPETGGTVTITATRTGTPSATASTVRIRFLPTGTATLTEPRPAVPPASGDDFNFPGAGEWISLTPVQDYVYTITIPAGDSHGSLTLTSVSDTTLEANETIPFEIYDASSAVPVNPATPLSVRIIDDDARVTLAASPTSIGESGGTSTVTASVSSVNANATVTVSLGFSGTAGTSEYTRSGTSITIPVNASSASITITSVNDAADELDETVIVAITGVTNATEDGAQQATVTIDDDDAPPAVALSVSTPAMAETGGSATVTATLAVTSTLPVTVGVEFSGSATGTTDYSSTATTITVPAGSTAGSTSITLAAAGDALDEDDETIEVSAAAATTVNADVSATAPVTVAITDDDPTPTVTLALSADTIAEDAGEATVTATLGAVSGRAVTVSLELGGTAANGTDYAASAASIEIPAGSSAGTATFTAVGDALDEADETITVSATATNATVTGTLPLVATIADDDTAGVTVDPTVATTTEAGGTASFTVALDSEPSGAVVIDVASLDTSEGTASPAQLTFTAADWAAPQAVTLTGVDDAVDDGDRSYTVAVTINGSATLDPAYGAIEPLDVITTNTDDDLTAVAVSPTSGLATTEAGGTASFTVTLGTEPAGTVVIDVTSEDAGEGTASPAHLTFTADDWATPQQVTLTGVDDGVDDGDQGYTVTVDVNVDATLDSVYDATDPDDVAATNGDDDTAAVAVSPSSGLATTEAGGEATFTVVLGCAPDGAVVIDVASLDAGEGSASPAQLTFTDADWATPQQVTLAGADDAVDDGDQGYTVAVATNVAATTDSAYDAVDPDDVTATNVDDDTAAVTVSPISGLTTTEAGGETAFTVVLGCAPAGVVVIDVAAMDAGEGTASPAQLTFTAADWATTRTVTLTGVDDAVDDGDQGYTIGVETNAGATTDPAYGAVDPDDVTATNTDDDTATVTVSPPSGLTTTEAGGTASFTVVLGSEPTGDVVIDVTSQDAGEGAASPAQVTFTAADWATPRTVTLTGVDDAVDDGDEPYTVVIETNTGAGGTTDAAYGAIDPDDVTATNTDDDTAAVTVSPTSGLTTTEAGGTASFTVVLGSEPTGDVVIDVTSQDAGEGAASPAQLTFTAADWATPRTVTLTGADDGADDGDEAYTVAVAMNTGAGGTADATYAAIDPADVAATNTDDDAIEVSVTPTAGLTTTEAGATAGFTVVIGSEPSGPVVIEVASLDAGEGLASPTQLTFTAADWATPQPVTLTGVDDAVDDGDQAYTVTVSMNAGATGDPEYHAVDPADVSATNADNDGARVGVAPTSGLTTTEAGGTASFTVVLESEPTGLVAIDVTSLDAGEATAAPAQLTFTAADWATPRTVTLTGVDEAVDDGDRAYTVAVATNAGATADPTYAAIDPDDVTATTTDDDTADITVTPTLGLTTTEAGGEAAFMVVLTSEPTGAVVIDATSLDAGEATAAPAQLTFTAADWSTPRTVTLTGVDDAVDDGDRDYTVTLAINAGATADTAYAAIDPGDVAATNTDDDTVGITVSPSTGLTTTEPGGTASFTVVLGSEPTGDVVIQVTSLDTGEGTAAPATLAFTGGAGGTWATAQTVTLTGVDDVAADGDRAWTVDLAVDGTLTLDPLYAAVVPADVAVANLDDDPAALAFAAQPGLVIAGQTITPAVTVQVRDAEGRLVPGATADVTLALGVNPPAGTLAGTVTVAAAGGVATFADLSIDLDGAGYALVATSPDLVAATTDPFDVIPVPITGFSGPSATGTGVVTASFTGGGPTCTFAAAELLGAPPGAPPLPPTAPPNRRFPHGLFAFTLHGCAGPVVLTITYPSSLALGAGYWKFGPPSPGAAAAWYEFEPPPAAPTATYTLTLENNALGDDDWDLTADIVDQGGPAVNAENIPALDPRGLALLALLLGVAAAAALRRAVH